MVRGSLRGILPSSWCEAREEVGPDATQKRQFVGQKNPHSRINSFRIQIACSNFNFWGPLGQVAISISKKYTCRWVLPKVEKPILRWDPGGAQKSDWNVHGWKGLYYGGILVAQNWLRPWISWFYTMFSIETCSFIFNDAGVLTKPLIWD